MGSEAGRGQLGASLELLRSALIHNKEEAMDEGKLKVVEEGTPEEQSEYATLPDLCEGNRLVEKTYPQLGGKTIRFNTYIPYDEGMRIQRKHQMDGPANRRDSEGYLLEILEKVLINPRIVTPADRQALRKAHQGVLFDILAEVLGRNDETYKKVVADLGPK